MIIESILEAPGLTSLHKTIKTEKLVNYLVHSKMRKFTPKYPFVIENSKYLVRTALDGEDLEKVLTLRHDVFYNEMLKKNRPLQIDIDNFDFICDHLMIIDKATGSCIGTYRVNSSRFSSSFYSATEFSIGNILALPGHKLELGRACIHRDYRNSYMIALLWKAVGHYIQLTKSTYIFGCSSIQTTALDEIASLHLYLKWKHRCSANEKVFPRRKFRISGLDAYAEFVGAIQDSFAEDARKQIPTLLKFYLKSGAVICGEPALDRKFACVDFFTLLDTTKLNNRIEEKFSGV
ncbi:GNAT family N-acetyltransferase [Desulfurispirillum indicum]|uniref:GNAT family N-acetyltransferase n=1 Tax=Desulfurispirillum indicum TaxID=936456 RepID=UPI001CFC1377|nr:GNAT family N-acetyltransferase [Desulfurispirillum indicum]UCZ55631.1 GNAT family N-acetyltransferase [Desulfurispirillum indicum]